MTVHLSIKPHRFAGGEEKISLLLSYSFWCPPVQINFPFVAVGSQARASGLQLLMCTMFLGNLQCTKRLVSDLAGKVNIKKPLFRSGDV
jgi:hypothetical protein